MESPHSTAVVTRSRATSPALRRLGRATPKKGDAVSLPWAYAPTSLSTAAALELAAVCPADSLGTSKPVLKKPGGTVVLARKRVYVADDE